MPTPFLPNAVQNKVDPKYRTGLLDLDPDTTPYYPLADALGYLEENKPENSEEDIKRIQQVQKINALGETLKLLSEGIVGGTTKADIPQRQMNPIALKSLQDYSKLNDEYKQRLNQWNNQRITGRFALAKAEEDNKQRMVDQKRADEKFNKEFGQRERQYEINNEQQNASLEQRRKEHEDDKAYRNSMLKLTEDKTDSYVDRQTGTGRPEKPPYYEVHDPSNNDAIVPINSLGILNKINDLIISRFSNDPDFKKGQDQLESVYGITQPEKVVQGIVTRYWDRDPAIKKLVYKLSKQYTIPEEKEQTKLQDPRVKDFAPGNEGSQPFMGGKMDLSQNPYISLPTNRVEMPVSKFEKTDDFIAEYNNIISRNSTAQTKWQALYNLAVAAGWNDKSSRAYATKMIYAK